MPSRPELYGGTKWTGLVAVGLFAVLAAVFLAVPLGESAGLPADVSITAAIGYAMFDLPGGGVESESFLAAFEIIDVVLVAALVGAVMLARRERSERRGNANGERSDRQSEAVRADGRGDAADGPGGDR